MLSHCSKGESQHQELRLGVDNLLLCFRRKYKEMRVVDISTTRFSVHSNPWFRGFGKTQLLNFWWWLSGLSGFWIFLMYIKNTEIGRQNEDVVNVVQIFSCKRGIEDENGGKWKQESGFFWHVLPREF